MLEIKLSEAEVKLACEQHLQYLQNQGKLMYLRLNAGEFMLREPDGNFLRRVRGTPKGTADFVVFQGAIIQMSHLGRLKGMPHPVCRVTFIECKKSDWEPSKNPGDTEKAQTEFQEKAEAQHARYFIVRDVGLLNDILGES